MKVAFLSLFVAIVTETISAQGIFTRRNNGDHVRALFDEEASMSADYVVSLSLSFNGGVEPEIEPAKIIVGKAGKMGKAGLMMSTPKSGKGGSMIGMGKSGKAEPMGKSGKADPPSYSPTFSPTVSPSYSPTFMPTVIPSFSPTFYPTETPTAIPSLDPTTLG